MHSLSKTMFVALTLAMTAVPVAADTIEVKMLNRGAAGSMVFEPDYVELHPGDSVKFRVGHKSHNAASIDGMVPEGYAGFKGQINEEIEVTFDQAGFYGIKCSPHYGMGMVMVVKVGDAKMTDDFRSFDAPGRAKKRFAEIISRIGQADQ